ncbi:hypothetical protein chiPu_0033539, partial [Chiloscyllium punctatum]|nr:hypothetical protein [Chiloscyllium punctatum]
MQRLMPAAAARDQRDLVAVRLAAAHEFALGAQRDQIGMRGRKAIEALGEHVVDRIDELLHGVLPASSEASFRSIGTKLQILVLTRFLHANRYPLRSKTLWWRSRLFFPHDADQAPREFLQQRVELGIALGAAEIRQMQRQRPLVRSLAQPADTAR